MKKFINSKCSWGFTLFAFYWLSDLNFFKLSKIQYIGLGLLSVLSIVKIYKHMLIKKTNV